jgi:photosystem II stability/assembly factor-like uncharacterized protein
MRFREPGESDAMAGTSPRVLARVFAAGTAVALSGWPVEIPASTPDHAPGRRYVVAAPPPFAEGLPTSDEFGRRAPAAAGAQGNDAAAVATETSGTAPDWEFVGPFGGTVECLAVSPVDPELVLAGMEVDFSLGLYRSVDGGRTWSVDSLRSAGGVHDIEFAPDGTAFVAAGYGAYRRAPSDAAWIKLPVGGYSFFHEICIHPTNPDELWLGLDQWVGPGSPTGVLRSRDGGMTWQDVSPPSSLRATVCTGIAFDPNDPSIVVVCFGYHYKGGQIWRSTDGGDSWLTAEQAFANPLTEVLHDGSRFLLSGGDVYAGQNVGVYSSTDGGASWNPVHGAGWPSRAVHDLEVDPRVPGTIFAATSRGVFQSTDHGTTWSFGVGASGKLSVRAVVCDPRDPAGVLLGTESMGAWRNEASDPTFRESSTGLRALDVEDVAVNAANPREVAVSFQHRNTGGIFSSVDGGRSWTLERAPSVRFGTLEFAADGVLYAVSEGPAEQGAPEGLYRREPDGRWTSLGPNPGPYYESDVRHFRTSRTNPDFLVLVGNDNRTNKPTIWRSTDRGAAWTRVHSGASRPNELSWVTHVEIVEDGTDRTMIASHTATGAVLTSTDGGGTWANLSSGIPDAVRGWGLSVSPVDARTLYLATSGDCYRSTDAGATWSGRGPSLGSTQFHCDPGNVDVIYGTGGRCVRSADGGATFAPFDAGLDAGAAPRRFTVRGGPRPALLLTTTRGLFFRALDEQVPGAALMRASASANVSAPRGAAAAGALAVTGPNPFRDATAVGFALETPRLVTLGVFDVRGVRLQSLVSRTLPAGAHRFAWDGKDASGRRAAPGVYFLRLAVGPERQGARVVLVR